MKERMNIATSEPIEFRDLGAKLRSARKLKRLRLKDVAELVDCSESLLSKIECDKATPSLRLLHRIASVLDTSIADLFSNPGEPDVTIYRGGQRPTVVIKDSHNKSTIRLERLAPYAEDKLLDGNVHIIEPGANNGGEIKHQGQEIGYVIEGRFELTVGERTFLLGVGDSFFFRSDLPHRYRNTGDKVAKVVWVNTPPTF
ncbi:MAG: cupin domain-containing protein [Pseudomonadota bacterium]